MIARTYWRLVLAALSVACSSADPQTNAQLTTTPSASRQPESSFSTLVFSRTEGFRHDSIPAGIAAIRQLGQQRGFAVEATEDDAVFTDEALAKHQVVVFLSTTGDVLNAREQSAFEKFIGGGGGFVGIHSAADTEYDWPFYGALLGAYFAGHPDVQQASIQVESSPTTSGLPRVWVRRDEWYNFQKNPRGSIDVLATLDERTYAGGMMGADHPIVWAHQFAGGRAWYTAGGHTAESFSEPLFLDHLGKGILWAAGKL